MTGLYQPGHSDAEWRAKRKAVEDEGRERYAQWAKEEEAKKEAAREAQRAALAVEQEADRLRKAEADAEEARRLAVSPELLAVLKGFAARLEEVEMRLGIKVRPFIPLAVDDFGRRLNDERLVDRAVGAFDVEQGDWRR